jgi:hypothetical protein
MPLPSVVCRSRGVTWSSWCRWWPLQTPVISFTSTTTTPLFNKPWGSTTVTHVQPDCEAPEDAKWSRRLHTMPVRRPSKVCKLLATSYLFLNIQFLKISDKSSTVQVVKQAGRQDKWIESCYTEWSKSHATHKSVPRKNFTIMIVVILMLYVGTTGATCVGRPDIVVDSASCKLVRDGRSPSW